MEDLLFDNTSKNKLQRFLKFYLLPFYAGFSPMHEYFTEIRFWYKRWGKFNLFTLIKHQIYEQYKPLVKHHIRNLVFIPLLVYNLKLWCDIYIPMLFYKLKLDITNTSQYSPARGAGWDTCTITNTTFTYFTWSFCS